MGGETGQDLQDFSGFAGLGSSTIPPFHHSNVPAFHHSILKGAAEQPFLTGLQDLQDWIHSGNLGDS
jgi:hypothetical protein